MKNQLDNEIKVTAKVTGSVRLIRLSTSVLIGALAFLLSYYQLMLRDSQAADFQLPLTAARILLDRGNPYTDIPFKSSYPYNFLFYYPLPAVIVAIPFTIFSSPYLAGALFFGLSSTLMAFGIIASGNVRMLPAFLSSSFFISASVAQWTPLIFGATLLPNVAFFLACKPNIGLAGFFYLPTIRKLFLFLAAFLVSFLIFPGWAGDWIRNVLQTHSHLPPFLLLPLGPVLLLSAFLWRKPEGRIMLLGSLIPIVPWFYDPLLLWLIPGTFIEGLILSILSWFAYWMWLHGVNQSGVFSTVVTTLYLPALLILFFDAWRRRQEKPSTIYTAG